MSDYVGELIAEYAAEALDRPSAEARRLSATEELAAAKQAVGAAEWRVTRAKEYLGMQRARLRRAHERLARLEAA